MSGAVVIVQAEAVRYFKFRGIVLASVQTSLRAEHSSLKSYGMEATESPIIKAVFDIYGDCIMLLLPS